MMYHLSLYFIMMTNLRLYFIMMYPLSQCFIMMSPPSLCFIMMAPLNLCFIMMSPLILYFIIISLKCLLSKPKLNHQLNSTEVRLHSYPMIHPTQTQLVYSKLARADNCPASKKRPVKQLCTMFSRPKSYFFQT